MNSAEFRRWLKSKGAKFDRSRGKGSHMYVTLNGKTTVMPTHRVEMPTGTGRKHQEATRPEGREMMLQYAAKLTPCLPEEGGYTVTFRDVPEAITEGDTLEEALHYAAEALELALEHYLDERRVTTDPTPRREGEYLVALPVSLSLKCALLNEMIRQDVRPAELAKRLKTSKQEVNRLTTLSHATKVDRIAEAFHALGKELTISVA